MTLSWTYHDSSVWLWLFVRRLSEAEGRCFSTCTERPGGENAVVAIVERQSLETVPEQTEKRESEKKT